MKTLVTYFSYSGVTKEMAEMIAEHTKGDLFRIAEKAPYSSNYNTCVKEAREEKSKELRPAMKEDIADERLAEYDVVFVGYPIWWYDAPMIIYTFLQAHDFTGKTIVPFATSGGSGFSGSEEKIGEVTGAKIERGLLFRGNAEKVRVEKWLDTLGLK